MKMKRALPWPLRVLGSLLGWPFCFVAGFLTISALAQVTPGQLISVTITNATLAVTQSGSWAVGISQWAGGTLGAMATYGTSPGAVLVPGVNAYVTNSNANGPALPANSSPVTESNLGVGVGSISPTQVSVGTTSTLIVAARTGAPGTGRVTEIITNTTTTPIFIGNSGVTITTGQLLPGSIGATITLSTTAALYGVVASGSATVTQTEEY